MLIISMLRIKSRLEKQIPRPRRAEIWQKMRQLEELPETDKRNREEQVSKFLCQPFNPNSQVT